MISCGILGTTVDLVLVEVRRFALEVEPIGAVGSGRLEQSSALFEISIVVCDVEFGHVWPLGERVGNSFC